MHHPSLLKGPFGWISPLLSQVGNQQHPILIPLPRTLNLFARQLLQGHQILLRDTYFCHTASHLLLLATMPPIKSY